MTGRIAWITGGSDGIGRALAIRMLQKGDWQVAVSARSEDRLKALSDAHPGIVSFPLDVTQPAEVVRVVDAIEDAQGLPDRVILNAGIYEPMQAGDVREEDYAVHMQVNYLGVTNCLAAVLPRMLARKRGQIVIMGSVAGYRGLPNALPYGPTKAALVNLAESLRAELQGTGVDIRLVSPGFVATRLTQKNRFPMPAMVTADEAADAILRGLERTSFEIAFPKRFVAWLKLLRCLPYAWYYRIARRMQRHER